MLVLVSQDSADSTPKRSAHCWEVAQREDAQETGLSAGTVTNDHKLPGMPDTVSSRMIAIVEDKSKDAFDQKAMHVWLKSFAVIYLMCILTSNHHTREGGARVHADAGEKSPASYVPSHHIRALLL